MTVFALVALTDPGNAAGNVLDNIVFAAGTGLGAVGGTCAHEIPVPPRRSSSEAMRAGAAICRGMSNRDSSKSRMSGYHRRPRRRGAGVARRGDGGTARSVIQLRRVNFMGTVTSVNTPP